MKVVSYRHQGQHGVGVVTGADGLVALSKAAPELPGDLRQILRIDPALARVRKAVAGKPADLNLNDIEFDPVIREPQATWALALNYKLHIEETGLTTSWEYPQIFLRMPICQVGHKAPLWAPRLRVAEAYDYEGELAVIIGQRARRVGREHATAAVAGYAVANDVTMRDFQYRTHQWLQGKAWDQSTPLGPHLVTADEIPDPGRLQLRTFVNGAQVQAASTELLIFDVATLVSVISEFATLEPGDVILTGTPGGVGFRREPQLLLGDGDVVVVEIDGIGRIENRFVAERAP